MYKNRIKAVCIICALLLLLSALVSCGGSTEPENASEVVMTVGGRDVTYEVYRYFALNVKKSIEPDDGEWEKPERAVELEKAAEEGVFKALRQVYGIFSACAENGIDPEGEQLAAAIDSAVKQTKASFDRDKDYKSFLSEQYMTENVHRLTEAMQICRDELYYAMLKNGKIQCDEEFLRDYIYGDGFIRVKQIFIVGESGDSNPGSTLYTEAGSHTDEEARALAEQARARAAAGEDFDALVDEYGESLFMFGNRDGYYICRGMWDSVNEEAVFGLNIGEVSPVVESDKGFSVFLRLDKEPEYIEKNFDSLSENYYTAVFTAELEKKSEELEIITNENYKSYSIKDIK